jgi:CubicO group peptidase (beta-lactamase class C family)
VGGTRSGFNHLLWQAADVRRSLLLAAVAALALITWTGFVVAGTLGGWFRTTLAPVGDARAFMDAAIARIEAENRGNIAFLLIQDGHVFGAHFQSVGAPVGPNSLFQVASLSKWITAWGVMTLVEAGRLDLDSPVSTWLTRWQLPESPYNDGVTVRRLLSHTAGLTDGLGYGGFAPGTRVQTLEESLTRALDAAWDADGVVRVGYAPGTGWRYSGGGYTLLQLLVEEVSGEPFDAYMRRVVLTPLGMASSTYVLDENAAAAVVPFYDTDGRPAMHYTYTATAAASLYTSAADLARFLQAQVRGPKGEPPGRGVLSPDALREMRRPQASRFGLDIWGLGPILYAPNRSGSFIIGHDGHNHPAINTTARLDPDTGDGVIILETGATMLATSLAGEWVSWQAGKVDIPSLWLGLGRTLRVLAGGWLAILVAAAAIGWRWRPRLDDLAA